MPRPRNPVSEAEGREMRRLYEDERVTLRELGERYDRNYQTISIAIRRAGGTIRPPGRLSRKPVEERKPCACGCGTLAKPGRVYVHGHHRRRKAAERREAAAAAVVEAAGADETCEYRATRYGGRARRTEEGGGDMYSRGNDLVGPACGAPVTLRGSGLCDRHQSVSAMSDHVSDEELARRLRQAVTVSCARCGLSWESTAMRASATFAFHTQVCPAA